MEPQKSVLLYSKFSKNSDKLLNIIKESRIEFNLQFVCIDNEKIRKQILQNNDIKVDLVPCILLIFSNGIIEKYDDIKAFQWVKDIININIKEKQEEQQKIQRQEQLDIQIKHNEQLERQNKEKERMLLEKEKKIEQEELNIKKKLSQKKYSNKLNTILEEDDRYSSLEPTKSIRNNEGTYIKDDSIFNHEKPENIRHIKNSIKTDNILLKAQQLEKSREED